MDQGLSKNMNPKAGAKGSCLITGGATRLGREIALAMATAGWDVAIHYRQSVNEASSVVAELQRLGRRAQAFQANLDQENELHALFDSVSQAFPDLCCLINNASRFEFDRPESPSTELLRSHMNTNLVAPVVLTQRLHDFLAKQEPSLGNPLGVVIHLLDQKLSNPNPDFFSYTLSKAALLEATRLSAMALAPVLRVAAIAPGITLASGDQTPEEFRKTHSMTVLGASSHPNEVANAVVWLASARAITGTMLLVDGGQHLTAQPRDVMMMIRE